MMKKTFLSLLFAAVLPTMFQPAQAAPYQGSRIFWDLTSRHNVFTNGNYARIIQLQDGRLMATCENGGIQISFSSDLGATWSTPVRIVNNTNNVPNCVPDLIQLKDGTIIVAYNPRPSKPYTEDRKFGIRCKRSTNNGISWSDEIFVNDAQHTFDDGCWEPSMLELPSGELQLYFADEGPYTTSSEQQISLSRSFDGGLTWAAPQSISFRAGYRDGMPSPVLLKDKSSIVVAIEDNGWPGIGDFFPTTVRCPLADNWGNNYYVDASSNNRKKTHSNNQAKGGAPYMRVLPWGETVLSWQSKYGHGDNYNMMTAVGDANAENFKALSNPFNITADKSAMWNSLAVVDTGVVVAVASIDNGIEMIKGYPMKQFEAAKGTPSVDGKIAVKEGYTRSNASQVMMGAQTGTRTAADFAYDSDNLYFVAKAIDRSTQTGAQGDGIRLLIDTSNNPSDRISETCYMLFLRRDGVMQAWRGKNGQWKTLNTDAINMKTSTNNSSYTVEVAVPWSVLGIDAALEGNLIGTNIEIQNRQESTTVTERIPDARQTIPSTWMRLYLQTDGQTADIQNAKNVNEIHVSINNCILAVNASKKVKNVDVFTIAGNLIANFVSNSPVLHVPFAHKGTMLVKAVFDDNTTLVKKIVAQT